MIKKILLVGQTPPPMGGQAMMIKRTLEGDYGKDIQLYHVRMNFSSSMDEIGSIKIKKIIHLFKIIYQIIRVRIINKPSILFYFPAGPDHVPVVRDILILLPTRWMFKKVIYQFRAAGLGEYIERKSRYINYILKKVYGRPDMAIVLSEHSPKDYLPLKPKNVRILHNGIEDIPQGISNVESNCDGTVRFGYLGVLKESKGVLDLLEAYLNHFNSKADTQLHLIGSFDSKEMREKVDDYLQKFEYQKNKSIVLHGLQLGKSKHEILSMIDIFVFPSFFESESLPGAILEAMSHSLPIIATKWRGIPSLVDEKNGILVEINSPDKIGEAMSELLSNKSLRQNLSKNSRIKFENEFTLDVFHNNLKSLLEAV